MLLLFNFSYLTSEESRQRNKAALWKHQCPAKAGGPGFLNHALGDTPSLSHRCTPRAVSAPAKNEKKNKQNDLTLCPDAGPLPPASWGEGQTVRTQGDAASLRPNTCLPGSGTLLPI